MFRTPLLRSAAALSAAVTLAGTAGAQTVASFDNTYGSRNSAGTRNSPGFVARDQQFTLGSLGSGGSAELTTTIRIDKNASEWGSGSATSNFFYVGFAPIVPATGFPTIAQQAFVGAPMLYFQTNSDGAGYCLGTDFWRAPSSFNIERGPNGICSGGGTTNVRLADGGQFVRFAMRVADDGSWQGRVTFLDAGGTPLVGSVGTWMAGSNPSGTRSTQNGLVVSGSVVDPTATFTPFLRLGPSFEAGEDGTVTVSNSALNVTANVVPEPGTVALTAAGLLGLAAAARRRRQA